MDVVVTKTTNRDLTTTVYQKATTTIRLLHFSSNHPIGRKTSCLRALFSKINSHCSTEAANRTEEAHLRKTCTANGYSNDFIRRHIRRHPQPKPMTTEDQRTATADDIPTQKWHTIQNIRAVSDGTGRMLAKYGIRAARKSTKALRNQLMLAKDPLKDEEKSGVVYCEECSSYYVGGTSKRLSQSLRSAVRGYDTNSHIWAHMSETGHVVDFKKAKVHAQAKSKGSRLVWEAWLSGPNALNHIIELHPTFLTLRHKLQQEDKRRIPPRNNNN